MRNFILILFLFTFSVTSSQNTGFQQFGSESSYQEYSFAFKLMPSTSGELIQCAVVRKNPDGRDEITFMSKQTWVRQFTGYEVSKANPDKENLAIKYNIFDVPSEVKSEDEIKEYTVLRTGAILSNMWRLRYSEYPFALPSGNPGKGWAAHPDKKIKWLPSESQMLILKEYGIDDLSNFCSGEDAFRLMKDIRTKEFQEKYNQSTEPASIENVNTSETNTEDGDSE